MSAGTVRLRVNEKRYVASGPAVLRDIHLDIAKSEFFTILGPSGCGKSTLLRLVAGLDTEYKGSVTVNGSAVEKPSRNIGILFQESRLLPWFTVRQNVGYALSKANVSGSERKQRVDELLDLVGLRAASELLPKELSGGMARRAALARAVANVPGVLLLDEPFSALDPLLRRELQVAVSDVSDQEDLTVLLVTHDVDEAVFMSDRISILGGSPGTQVESFQVGLPKPRQPLSTEFGELRTQVLKKLLDVGSPEEGRLAERQNLLEPLEGESSPVGL